MAKKTVPDMKELFRQAAEIAQEVPESMQESAFNRALDLLVGSSSGSGPGAREPATLRKKNPAAGEQPAEQSFESVLRDVDSTQHPGIRSAARVLDQSLMILQVARHDHSVDGLTPTEIALLLTEKFRLSTTRQSVGMALRGAVKLVDRIAEGRGYRYRIMGPGEEYLAHLKNGGAPDESAPNVKTNRKRKPRRAKRASREGCEPATAEAPTGDIVRRKKRRRVSAASTQHGPKAAILSLVESEFFTEGRTVPAVKMFLKNKRGYDFGADQLRMALLRLVRDGVLDRDEGSEGQYEYKQS